MTPKELSELLREKSEDVCSDHPDVGDLMADAADAIQNMSFRLDMKGQYGVRLMSENAKLRELVEDMYHEIDALTQYDAGGGRGIVTEYLSQMQALGIEVKR